MDQLFATVYPTGHVDFGIEHTGHGIVGSEFLPLDYDKEHELEVLMGSLYPPAAHGYFTGWAQADVDRARTVTRLRLDGIEIINGNQSYYEPPPGQIHFGRNPFVRGPAFTGQILAVERLPLPDAAALRPPPESGIWSLHIEFRTFSGQPPQPLLASGQAGHGNLLLVEYAGPNLIRFGHDQWNHGYVRSEPVALDPALPHRFEVLVGPLAARQMAKHLDPASAADAAGLADRLRVWLDGQLVWETTITGNRGNYDFVAVGKNPQGFSSATAAFDGVLRRRLLAPSEEIDFVRRNLNPPGGGNRAQN